MKPINLTIIMLVLFIGQLAAQKNGITVRNLEKVNSEFNDLHAIPFGDELIVTSGRDKSFLVCADPELKDERYTHLYTAQKDGKGSYEDVQVIDDLKVNYHDAVPTIHPNGKFMVFTRTYVPEPELKVLQLFSAEYINGKWSNVTSLPCNSTEFSNLHPAFSADGSRLFFASNRAPGGGKNTNIFVMPYADGKWGSPDLLDETVNTKGTEYFLFVDENDRLYFSSDGHKGYGGLDIFMTENIAGAWTKPESLPKPINSRSDDFSFVSLAGGNQGFLASNRKGGKGKDDIYAWTLLQEKPEIKLIVTNKTTDVQLGEAEVTIDPILKKVKNTVFLDEENIKDVQLFSKAKEPLNYTTIPQAEYMVRVNKEGFEPLELKVTAEELAENEVFKLPLKPIKVLKNLEITILNVQTLEPIPQATVKIIDKNSGIEKTLTTNEFGIVSSEIDCKSHYEIVANKTGFMKDLVNLACRDEASEPIKAIMKLAPPVSKGLVIVLENVYYDFDKDYIRPDAALELDKVVRLMQRYTSMEIELGSHTDVRGNDEYNRDLSQRRANSAVEYIISRGISRDRITALGYGETQIVNQCSNGVNCSEEEHQQNRRTEIKVTELDEENVTVKN